MGDGPPGTYNLLLKKMPEWETEECCQESRGEDKKGVSGSVHTQASFLGQQRTQRDQGGGLEGDAGAGTLTRRSLRSKAACGLAPGNARAGSPSGARSRWRRGWSPSHAGSGAGDRVPDWTAAPVAAAREADPRVESGAGTSRRTLRGGRGLPA